MAESIRRRDFIAAVPAVAAAALIPSVSSGISAGQTGRKASTPVLDSHVHSMSQALHDLISPFVRKQGGELKRFTGAEIVDYLDRIGARRACALSSGYMWGGSRLGKSTASAFAVADDEVTRVQAENDFVARQAIDFPERLVPFAGINPLKPYALEELARCVDTQNMRGLKLHFSNSAVNLRDDRHLKAIQPVFEYAATNDLPIMLHFFRGRVEEFGATDFRLFADAILAEYSDLRICFAHFLGGRNYADEVGDLVDAAIRVLDEQPELNRSRLFLDLAVVLNRQPRGPFKGVTDQQLDRLGGQMRAWGLNNILWGSDNFEDYVAKTKDMWPLGGDELSQVLSNDGSSFIG